MIFPSSCQRSNVRQTDVSFTSKEKEKSPQFPEHEVADAAEDRNIFFSPITLLVHRVLSVTLTLRRFDI